MTNHPHRRGNWRSVYGIPIVIGMLSTAGLLSALLSTGAGRVFAWLALGLPLAIVGYFYLRARR